jgi:hypothetical protein
MTEHYIISSSSPLKFNIAAILASKQEMVKDHPHFLAFGPITIQKSDPDPFVSIYKTRHPTLRNLERYEGVLFGRSAYCFHVVYLE